MGLHRYGGSKHGLDQLASRLTTCTTSVLYQWIDQSLDDVYHPTDVKECIDLSLSVNYLFDRLALIPWNLYRTHGLTGKKAARLQDAISNGVRTGIRPQILHFIVAHIARQWVTLSHTVLVPTLATSGLADLMTKLATTDPILRLHLELLELPEWTTRFLYWCLGQIGLPPDVRRLILVELQLGLWCCAL